MPRIHPILRICRGYPFIYSLELKISKRLPFTRSRVVLYNHPLQLVHYNLYTARKYTIKSFWLPTIHFRLPILQISSKTTTRNSTILIWHSLSYGTHVTKSCPINRSNIPLFIPLASWWSWICDFLSYAQISPIWSMLSSRGRITFLGETNEALLLLILDIRHVLFALLFTTTLYIVFRLFVENSLCKFPRCRQGEPTNGFIFQLFECGLTPTMFNL